MLPRLLPMLALPGAFLAHACLAQPAAQADPARMLVGVWRAVPGGIYAEDETGKKAYPFGQNGVSRVILTADGFGANALQTAGRTNCATGPGPRQCTAAEAEAAFQAASIYQYRYRLEPDANSPLTGKMIWDVDLSAYPNWTGQTLVRRYEMKPDGTGWKLLAPLPSNPKLAFTMTLERER